MGQVGEGDDAEEEEEDYIDSDDEREEGERAPDENAFVYIDNSGKLVYVDPEEDEEEDKEAGLEEKEVTESLPRVNVTGVIVCSVCRMSRLYHT